MKDISIKEIIDLVMADISDAELIIQKMFDWNFERNMTITKWFLGAAASIFVAVIASTFQSESKIVWWQLVLVISSSIAAFIYSIFRLWQIRSTHKNFIAALKLYKEIQKISIFIKKYRTITRSGNE